MQNGIESFIGSVELAARNADPDNWQWSDKYRAVWGLADDDWQEFKARWHGATESQSPSLVDPKSPSLSLGALSDYLDQSVSRIFVRKSYVTMFNYLWAQALSSQGENGVIITGQPGTGKTLFQYYLLVQLLQRKQVVLFSPTGKFLYLFYHDKVYTIRTAALASEDRVHRLFPQPKSSSSNVFIWSLFDIAERKEPESFLVCKPCLPVQTASPDPCRYRDWERTRTPLLTGLPLWTRDELVQGLPYQEWYQSLLDALRQVYGGSSQNQSAALAALDRFPGARALLEERYSEEDSELPSPADALDYLLEAAIDRFGYSARDVFGAVFNYMALTNRHERTFRIKYANLLDAVSALPNFLISDQSISNEILVLCPVYRGPLVDTEWTVDFKSDWVARSVIRGLDEAEGTATCRQISLLRSNPQAQGLARRFLEPVAHRKLAEIPDSFGFWVLIEMASNNAEPPQFAAVPGASSRGPALRLNQSKREVIKLQSIADLSTCLKSNAYYIPCDPSFPMFDAFTIDLDRSKKSAVLWVIRISASRMHAGSALGYQKVRSIVSILKDGLGEDPPLKKTRTTVDVGQVTSPTPLVEVRYLLVVPKDEPQNRKWDFPKGWSKNCEKNDHRGDVYCLELPLTVCPAIIEGLLSFECIASS